MTDPFAPSEPTGRRAIRFVLVACLHVVVLGSVVELSSRPEVRVAAQQLYVRLVELAPPRAEPPRPTAPQPVRKEAVFHPVPTAPVLTTAAEVPAVPNFAVPPQPPVPPALPSIQAAVPVAPVVTAARFDADYLHNPKPVYPAFSRRMNEEGKVQLRVRVGTDGLPLLIEVKDSSGFPRLDAAAREAVAKWRFVPAKRGDEAIESWVGVPIVFKLDT